MKKMSFIKLLFLLPFCFGISSSKIAFANKNLPLEQETKETKKEDKKTKKASHLEVDLEQYKVPGFSAKLSKLKLADGRLLDYIIYTHNKTGARWVQMLVDDVKDLDYFHSNILFPTSLTSDKGVWHALEHLVSETACLKLFRDGYKLKIAENADDVHNIGDVNAFTVNCGFSSLFVRSRLLSDEILSIHLKELANPVFLNDNGKFFSKEVNKKYKGIQTGRVYDEMVVKSVDGNNYFLRDVIYRVIANRFYNNGGEPKKIVKLTLKDVEDAYKRFIHPSNCTVVHFADKRPEEVKKLLTVFANVYLKNYSKKEIEKPIIKMKSKEKYKSFKVDENKYIFDKFNKETRKTKRKAFKYAADLVYKLSDLKRGLNSFEIDSFCGLKFDKFKRILEEEVTNKMGYGNFEFLPNYGGTDFFDYFAIGFSGNDENLFTEKALKNNAKKVIEVLCKKLEILQKNGHIKKYIESTPKTPTHSSAFNQFALSYEPILKSLHLYNEPFSDKVFPYNDGIIDLSIGIENYTIKNLDVFNLLKEAEPSWINVYKATKFSKRKYFIPDYVLPIIFPKELENKKVSSALRKFATFVFSDFYTKKVHDLGISYYGSWSNKKISDSLYLASRGGKEAKEAVTKFIETELGGLVKCFSLPQKDFDAKFSLYRDRINETIRFLKSKPKQLTAIASKIDGMSDSSKPSEFDDVRKELVEVFFHVMNYAIVFFEDEKEFIEIDNELGSLFRRLFKQKIRRELDSFEDDKFDVKEFKEISKIFAEKANSILVKALEYANKVVNELRSVRKEDVEKYIRNIKSCSYKQANPKSDEELIKEFEEKAKKFQEDSDKEEK